MPSITVKGMSCGHCRESVTKALEALPGVSGVSVDLETGKADWQEATPINPDTVKKAILDIGFEVAE